MTWLTVTLYVLGLVFFYRRLCDFDEPRSGGAHVNLVIVSLFWPVAVLALEMSSFVDWWKGK